MRKPKNSKVATTNLDKEVIVIDTDTDTDEVGGRMLALCGVMNAKREKLYTSGDNGENNRASMQIVCADNCDSGLDYDLEYKKYLASCSENQLCFLEDYARDSTPMCLMFNVDNEVSDRRKGRPVKTEKSRARAGRKAKCPTISSVSKRLNSENGRADHKSISVKEAKSLVERKAKSPLIPSVSKRLKTENCRVGHKMISVRKEKDRSGRKACPTISSVSKRLKTESGRADHKSISLNKEKSRAGRKSKSPLVPSVSKRLKTEKGRADRKSILRTVFRTKETQQKKGDAHQGMKKACKKDNEERSARREIECQMISKASKKLKTESADHNSISRTIPVVNIKDTQQKKGEVMRGRKIPVTKNNVESKSTSHVKYNILHSFRAWKKDDEERLSAIDKSYAYYLTYLRNSITIVEPDQQVKPVKDLVCLSDSDIIAVSDRPFSDGGHIPFETNKDGKVIDLEDGIEPDDIFNSLFSKKLLEILKKPYDKKEFLKLYNEVTLKRPLTRCRQLRDGREIEYNVDQLALSYLEQYEDFNKKFCRYGKGDPKALNLLRGFFFYFKNIVLEGAFKPWMYEKRLENICFSLMLEDGKTLNAS